MPSNAHEAIVAAMRASMGAAVSPAEGPLDVETLRSSIEQMMGAAQPPEGTRTSALRAGGVDAEWIDFDGADGERAILYLHGGGYVVGSIASHRALCARIAMAAGVRALIIDYRLGPEHPFPAAVEDAAAAYRHMLEEGLAPEQIAIGGDSAGGGLTFATLVALKEAGLPLPGSGFALSPWVDLEGLGESMETRVESDPMVRRAGLRMMADLYLGGADPRSPLAAPLYADLSGLPPVLIQVGTAECLLDDAVRIAEALRAAGCRVELEAFEDLIHVFQAFAPAVPEAVEAIEKIGAFVARTH